MEEKTPLLRTSNEFGRNRVAAYKKINNGNKMTDKETKFDYGESIIISKKAPDKYHPSEEGFICGMIYIDSEEAAIAYDCIGSDWLYTVELLNGHSLQIPEKYLEKDSSG